MYEENEVPEGFVEVRMERGGERLMLQVPEGATIKALIEDGHLRGINVASTRVNGAQAEDDTVLQGGDSVSQIPKSGTQGR